MIGSEVTGGGLANIKGLGIFISISALPFRLVTSLLVYSD